jgi:hypothetical protein
MHGTAEKNQLKGINNLNEFLRVCKIIQMMIHRDYWKSLKDVTQDLEK